MSVQNRLRAVVSVGLLLAAFAIFAPYSMDSTEQSDSEASSESALDGGLELDWHDDSSEKVASNDNEIRPLFFDPNRNVETREGTVIPTPQKLNNTVGTIGRSRTEQPGTLNSRSPMNSMTVAYSNMIPIDVDSPANDPIDYRVESIPHVIEFGESLQSISTKYYGQPNEYLHIYEFNQDVLEHPVNLPVGTEIRIPRSR